MTDHDKAAVWDECCERIGLLIRTPPGVKMSEHTEGIVHAVEWGRSQNPYKDHTTRKDTA